MRKSSLSLVELLVALAILIVLTTVSIQATEGIIKQRRFDAALLQLNEIEAAIIGRPHVVDANGQSVISGYVADVGELPERLLDLFDRPDDVVPFTFATPSTPTSSPARIGTGWRGPYLRTPLGVDLDNFFDDKVGFKDPYGEFFVLADPDGVVIPVADRAMPSVSPSKIGRFSISTVDFDRPLGKVISDSPGGGLHVADVNVSLKVFHSPDSTYRDPMDIDKDGNVPMTPTDRETFAIYLHEPDGAGGVKTTTDNSNVIEKTVTFNSVTVGPRVLEVVEITTNATTIRRGLLNITVRPNGPNVFTIRAQ